MSETPVVLPLVDNPHAVMVYADELTGVGTTHNNVTLTFSVLQYDHNHNPPKPYRRVCLRLLLPVPGLLSMTEFIMKQLKKAPPGSTDVPEAPTLQ